jgi:hypothetical protein
VSKHGPFFEDRTSKAWIPAFAGMTTVALSPFATQPTNFHQNNHFQHLLKINRTVKIVQLAQSPKSQRIYACNDVIYCAILASLRPCWAPA